jgi:hypothetical protein
MSAQGPTSPGPVAMHLSRQTELNVLYAGHDPPVQQVAETESAGRASRTRRLPFMTPSAYPRFDRSISTGKGAVALTIPVNTSPSRYSPLAESSR